LGGGFDSNLGNPEYEALSYHVYCGVNNKEGSPASRLLCNVLDTTFVDAKEKNIQSMRVGGILSEFGALTNSTKSANELNYLLNKADHNLRSWSHWAYKGKEHLSNYFSEKKNIIFFPQDLETSLLNQTAMMKAFSLKTDRFKQTKLSISVDLMPQQSALKEQTLQASSTLYS